MGTDARQPMLSDMGKELTDQKVYGFMCVDHYLQGVKFPATMVVHGDSVCQEHGAERMEWRDESKPV